MKEIRLTRAAGLTALALLTAPAVLSQAWAAPPPWASWAKTYGGTGEDFASSVQQTSDGGFVVAGGTNSSGAGSFDTWVLRLDSSGGIAWQNAYGRAGDDLAFSIQETSDGGFVLAGCTTATPRPLPFACTIGASDAWVLKLDAVGDVVWDRTYGGSGADLALSVQQTLDSGFVVSGFSERSAWVFTLDAVGNLNWQKAYEGFGCCILPTRQTSDDGFIVAGFSSEGGATQVLRLDGEGNALWLKKYAGIGFSAAFSVQQTFDGGFVVAGITNGFPRDGGIISGDFWVLRLDSTGDVIWQKAYGGTGADYAGEIQQTSDGGFAVVGWTDSFGAGGRDAWVLRLDAMGDVIWEKAYGGAGDEVATFVHQTSGGGFAVAGLTNSQGAGSNDFLVLKLDAKGNIGRHCRFITVTSAMVTETAATISPTTATVTTTNVTGMVNNAAVAATSAEPHTMCRSRR